MANRVRPITVTEADRHELERLQRAPSIRAGLSRRARAVLLMAQGLSGVEIAAAHGVHGRAGQPAAAPLRGGRRRRLARAPPVGPAARRSARGKRAQIVALTLRPPAAGDDPLDDAGAGPPGRGVAHHRASDLEGACAAAASGDDVQVHHRSAGGGEDRRRGGAVSATRRRTPSCSASTRRRRFRR